MKYWERFLGNTEKVIAFEVVREIERTCFEVCDVRGFFLCACLFWSAYVEGVYVFILWSEYISLL